jgi:hypothetical protein
VDAVARGSCRSRLASAVALLENRANALAHEEYRRDSSAIIRMISPRHKRPLVPDDAAQMSTAVTVASRCPADGWAENQKSDGRHDPLIRRLIFSQVMNLAMVCFGFNASRVPNFNRKGVCSLSHMH